MSRVECENIVNPAFLQRALSELVQAVTAALCYPGKPRICSCVDWALQRVAYHWRVVEPFQSLSDSLADISDIQVLPFFVLRAHVPIVKEQ